MVHVPWGRGVTSMQVRRICTESQLAELAGPWNLLSNGVPFRSAEWLHSWWRSFSRNRELFVLAVHEARGAVVGIVPCFRERGAGKGRVLRFLGTGSVCSDYLSLLCTRGFEECVAEEVAGWLTGGGGAADRWDLFEMEGVTAADACAGRLAAHLARNRCSVHCRPAGNCWRIALPATVEEYLPRLGRSRRQQARRWLRRIAQGDGVAIRVAETPSEVAMGMEILVDLHQRRRRSLGEKGCFSCVRFSEFLREAARLLCAAGKLQICWLELEGRPAAVELLTLSPEGSYAYQSGIDPAASRQSPGHLLTIALIQRGIARGDRFFDFLRGEEAYKASWAAEPVPLVKLRVVPHRPLPQLRHGVWLAGRTVKTWLKGRRSLEFKGH